MTTISEVMRQVAADCKSDVDELEGKPLTGRTVATAFGNTNAMLAAVAKAVALLAEKVES